MSDPRRQSSRLKKLPVKTFKDTLDENEDPTITAISLGKGKNLKRKRDEEPFVEHDEDQDEDTRRKKPKKASRGKLDLLPTLPSDIFEEILSHFHPKSLLALIRVNHAFREELLDPKNTIIWTRVRRSCMAPDPFPGTAEIDWFKLLFAGTRCMSCGTKNVHRIEFVLTKRLCFNCVQSNGVAKGRFKEFYPGEDKRAIDLVIPVDGGRRSSKTLYYDRAEVQRVLQAMKACKDKKELENYFEERRAYLDQLREHVARCYSWMVDDYKNRKTDVKALREARYEAVKSRLEALEYTEIDIKSIKNHRHVFKDTPLTNRVWDRIEQDIVQAVINFRARRLLVAKDQLPFVASRCNLILQCFNAYKLLLAPEKWRDLPSVEAVWLLPSMKQIVALPDNRIVTEHDLVGPSQSLPKQIRDMMNNLKSKIDYDHRLNNYERASLTTYRHAETFSPWLEMGKKSEVVEEAKKIHLFTSKGVCLDPATVQGRCRICRTSCTSSSALLKHITGSCCLRSEYRGLLGRLDFDPVRSPVGRCDLFFSRTAPGLIHATGLNLFTATANEMDDRGAFYRCLRCPSDSTFIGTWRECLVHSFGSAHDDISQGLNNPFFEIIEGGAGGEVEILANDSRRCWSCNHCSANAEDLWSRDMVLEHLEALHGISEAHVPKDFLCAIG
ncbi:hypothetical protein V5O48_014188 [Marasmius crinis-equi]|uniref:F-box domain-containing protein n=1 Tax=Marasmius crinis-equi TaxID=585013 RepID=A0ABR3EY14_9AGAR